MQMNRWTPIEEYTDDNNRVVLIADSDGFYRVGQQSDVYGANTWQDLEGRWIYEPVAFLEFELLVATATEE